MGFLAYLAVAAAVPQPLADVTDHPIVSRYAGSVLQNASSENYVSLRLPLGPGSFKNNALAFKASTTVEGTIAGYFYVNPAGRTPLEIFRNYVAALEKAHFRPLYTCEGDACANALINEQYKAELIDPRRWRDGRSSPAGGSSPRELRYWSGKAQRGSQDVFVVVWAAGPNSVWETGTTTVIVIEPKPIESGQVLVSLDALRKGLETDGKVTLLGLFFDTGKATLKAESKPQLDEMAKLLEREPSLKVFIVGHTDNQGSLETNLALSQQRAEAVVAALVQQHHVAANRLAAKGVANFAPLAENRTEAGRAMNRRVELVAQ